MIARTERAMTIVANNEGEIRDFQALYQKLYKECEVNQISDEKKTKKVRDIVASLDSSLTGKEWNVKEKRPVDAKGTYPGTRDGLAKMRSALGGDGKTYPNERPRRMKRRRRATTS